MVEERVYSLLIIFNFFVLCASDASVESSSFDFPNESRYHVLPSAENQIKRHWQNGVSLLVSNGKQYVHLGMSKQMGRQVV
jgi:hypothetical protein